jgi:hypothetical protein
MKIPGPNNELITFVYSPPHFVSQDKIYDNIVVNSSSLFYGDTILSGSVTLNGEDISHIIPVISISTPSIGSDFQSLDSNLTLTSSNLPYQDVLPDANRDVILPSTSNVAGFFTIFHVGDAYELIIKNSNGDILTFLVQNTAATVKWVGGSIQNWKVLS